MPETTTTTRYVVFFDVGCGWGNLAHYAAVHYSIKVHGITISDEQQN